MKLLLVFIFLASILFSKEISDVTLDDAIKIALENNKKNKISKLALQIADAQYNQAISANYPTINAMLVGQRKNEDRLFEMKGDITLPEDTAKSLALATLLTKTNPFTSNPYTLSEAQGALSLMPASTFKNSKLSMDTDITAAGRDTIKGSINLQYPIYTGGKVSSLIEQARLNKHLALNNIKREDLNVVYDTKKYFYGYVLTNELHKIVKGTLSRMKYIESLTKTFYESGESLNVKKTDYLSVQVTVSLIESMLAKIESNRILVKSALVNAMGLKWNDDINPKYTNKLLPPNYTIAGLVEEAYKNNSDITKMDIALKITDQQIKEQQSGHYPQLVFLGEVSKTVNSYEYGFLSDDQQNEWNIGFAANIPLFDGFRTTNSVNEKRLEKKKMYLLQDMLKEGVALQVKNELTKALIGFKQIQTLKKAKKLAKQSRELNIKGYQIDAIEPEEVIQSQYIEAYVKADYLKYVHDYLLSLATIDRLVGKEIK